MDFSLAPVTSDYTDEQADRHPIKIGIIYCLYFYSTSLARPERCHPVVRAGVVFFIEAGGTGGGGTFPLSGGEVLDVAIP